MSTRTAIIIITVSFAIGGAASYGIDQYFNHSKNTSTDVYCEYALATDNHFDFIKPLLFAEPNCESESHQDLKSDLTESIDSLLQKGDIERASIYWRDLQNGSWIHVNPEQKFHPGSLLKLGAFFNILQQASYDTTLLNQKVVYNKTNEPIPAQSFSNKSIVEGQSYSVKTLLEYMIAYSDNYATSQLHSIMNYSAYLKIFSSLHLPEPDGSDPNYSLTSSELSNFFKVLYNGTFLNPEMSELAIQILMTCDFVNGMVAGLPAGTKIAHKFGEWGNKEGQHELHEMAIIYMANKPYLLTIMTSGKDLKALGPCIATLTKKTHQHLRNLNRQLSTVG